MARICGRECILCWSVQRALAQSILGDPGGSRRKVQISSYRLVYGIEEAAEGHVENSMGWLWISPYVQSGIASHGSSCSRFVVISICLTRFLKWRRKADRTYISSSREWTASVHHIRHCSDGIVDHSVVTGRGGVPAKVQSAVYSSKSLRQAPSWPHGDTANEGNTTRRLMSFEGGICLYGVRLP